MTGFQAPVAVSVWEETDRRRGNPTVVIQGAIWEDKGAAQSSGAGRMLTHPGPAPNPPDVRATSSRKG